MKLYWMAIAAAASVCAPALAQQPTEAFAPLVVVGEHDVVDADGMTTMTGAMHGPLYVDDERGAPVERGEIRCQFALEIDSATLERGGAGTCEVTLLAGGGITADISCASAGDARCAGDFIITGGTGRLAGVTGTSKVEFQTRNKGYRVGADGALMETVFGVAYWSELSIVQPN